MTPLMDDYQALLTIAHDASQAVSLFDLQSEVPKNITELAALQTKSQSAHLDLINFIIQHGPELVSLL